MLALIELLRTLFRNLFELTDIFARQIVLAGDPLAAVLWLVGQIIIVGSVLVMGYLTLGALLREIGISLPNIGETRRS